jgi:hypothetical protein
MPLAAEIHAVLKNGGTLKRVNPRGVQPDSFGEKFWGAGEIIANYREGIIAADPASNTLTFTIARTPTAISSPAQCVEVCFEALGSRTGALSPPGVIFTDSLSGCVALLFRDSLRNLHLVHQYRDTQYRHDPTSDFTKLGATLIWKYASVGISDAHPGCFGVALCCADNLSAHCFAFAGKGTPTGLKCESLIFYDHIQSWNTAAPWTGPNVRA